VSVDAANPANRPGTLVLVTGTSTGVGKTWWAAETARALRSSGIAVAARKPAQSFSPGETPTDADVLAAATGEPAHDVCPPHRWYETAMAPPMAAETLGRPAFTIAELAGELTWPTKPLVGLVEGAGGPRSPLAADGDTVDLAAAVAPDHLVLVADAGLGTINAVRLAAAVLAGIAPVTVVLNRFDAADGLHARNRAWLEEREGLAVVDSVDALLDRIGTRSLSWGFSRPIGR
jgi:dethiobiotin synthetase